MSTFSPRHRSIVALVVSATVLAAGFTASTGANAGPINFPHPIIFPHPITFPHPGPGPINQPGPKSGWNGGFGYGAAGLAGGLALGAIATGAAIAAQDSCIIVRRVFVDAYGDEVIRRVRVCQ